MNFEEILKRVKKLLPHGTEHQVLENVVLQSSHITFEAAGETLFRPGDAPLGFYWILTGEVQEKIGGLLSLKLGPGHMVGLEEFLGHAGHHSHWITLAPTEALFLDRRSFGQFSTSGHTQDLISSQLARHLLEMKRNWPLPGSTA